MEPAGSAEPEYLSFPINSKATADVGNINILDVDHHQPLERALMRILHTDHAEEAYAEILDGMPTAATFRNFCYASKTHPSKDHPELCPGFREKAREFRASFDVTTLQFSLFTLLAFQDASPGSKQFHLRLLELLAVSCHQIAVYLYKFAGRNQHHEHHDNWRVLPQDRKVDPWDVQPRPPIAFTHGSYRAFDQYPHGLADVAGYWAEAKIFGGIIVFDRGETEVECRELYIHACLTSSPRTLFPLTTEQFDQLIHFLLDDRLEAADDSSSPLQADDSTPASCPLPIQPTQQNRFRWDPWEAFARYHIFRDRYERKVTKTKPRSSSHRSPRNIDWPEVGDEVLLLHLYMERREGTHIDQTRIDDVKRTFKMVTPSSPCWPGICNWVEESEPPYQSGNQ